MTWEEWLFLEAFKETGGEFQMQWLSPVKEIYQDGTFLYYLPSRCFSASSLQQLVQPLSGKFGEREGGELKWGIDGLFNRKKKNSGSSWDISVTLVALFDLCQHFP